jgi:hypothetical protein
MSNRINTVPSLVVVAFLASVVSTAIASIAARAADDCLTEPKHEAPPGARWYYRIDSPNYRKCWFLGDEDQKVTSASSPLPLPRQAEAAIQPSLADAHAELPTVTTPAEPPPWLGSTRMWKWKTLSPPSTRDAEGETKVMSNVVIDGQSTTESLTKLPPGATDREVAAELPAEETTAGPLRMGLGLLMIALGLSTIAGCLIFKLSAAVKSFEAP